MNLPAVTYPEGSLDISETAARLRLEPDQSALNAMVLGTRALETSSSACVVVHGGSNHERLLTRIGEVSLRQDLWAWYLRGKPSSAVAIVVEMPALRSYVETRTARMIEALREEKRFAPGASSQEWIEARICELDRELQMVGQLPA